MKVAELKLEGTAVKFYDDFTGNYNRHDNIKLFEQMLSLVFYSLLVN